MTERATKLLALALKPVHRLKKNLKARKKSKSSSWLSLEVSKEFVGLMLAALTVVITLALLSYDHLDNLLQVGQEGFVNWLGPAGAIIAGSLYSLGGLWAFFVPCATLALSLRLILSVPLLGAARLSGIIGMVLGLSPVMALLGPVGPHTSFLLSGSIGESLRQTLLAYFSQAGLWIICCAVSLCGLLLVLNRPYLARSLFIMFQTVQKIKLKPKVILEEKKLENKSVPPQALTSAPLIHVRAPIEPLPIESAPITDIQIVERDRASAFSAVKKAEQDSTRREFSFTLPPLKLLDYDAPSIPAIDSKLLKIEAEKLQQAFLQFGIEGKIREIRPGPVVTNYEFVPAPGIKLSRIAALSDDIAMAMSAVQVRIVTPIPGKGAVGIEVPNARRETVYLKEIVADERYRNEQHKLCMAIGKDVEGAPYFMNLADMPHVLIAGTTGSGKSVSVNAMICSILYRATPEDVRFLFIDPKMLELSIYNGIPHLLLPPIIDSKKAANALRWAVKEMDERYALMKEAAVRDITTYNERLKVQDDLKPVSGRAHSHLPYLVIVVDEYADLLAVAGKEVEAYVMRLAQKARACGIHVMLATQRPSVDVITGVIKANFPVRMGFRLASSHDSKTIINKTGAEKLLGRGDVLIMPPGTSDLFRIHGAFVSEKELSRVVQFWREQKNPEYRNEIADFEEGTGSGGDAEHDKGSADEKYDEALAIVRQYKRCSTSFLQRQLSVGYNRAARIVEQMEKAGHVGPVLNARGEREIFFDN